MGIARVTTSGLFGIPTLCTTYNRALQYLPNTRFTIAHVLVEPKSEADTPGIKAQIAKIGFLGLTDKEFQKKPLTSICIKLERGSTSL